MELRGRKIIDMGGEKPYLLALLYRAFRPSIPLTISYTHMSKVGDVIRDISGWEEEAGAEVERSEAEALALVERARQDSRGRLEAVREKCAAERDALLEAAEADGRREAEEIASYTRKALERMKESFPSRRQAAIDSIIKEMREAYGGR